MKLSSIFAGVMCSMALIMACSFNLEAKHHHHKHHKHHKTTNINVSFGSASTYATPTYVVDYRPVVYPATTTYVVYPTTPSYDYYVSYGWIVY